MGKKNVPTIRTILIAIVFGIITWSITSVAFGQYDGDVLPIEEEIECNEDVYERIELEKSLITEAVLWKLTLQFTRDREPEKRRYVRACQRSVIGCPARVRGIVELIVHESLVQQIDPWLIAAIVWRESRFDPFAVGEARGERGVMQLNPHGVGARVRFVRRSENQYRRDCRHDPYACQHEVIREGVGLVTRSIERCGNVWSGLRMYNSGRCDYRGSNRYARKILADSRRLKEWAVEDGC